MEHWRTPSELRHIVFDAALTMCTSACAGHGNGKPARSHRLCHNSHFSSHGEQEFVGQAVAKPLRALALTLLVLNQPAAFTALAAYRRPALPTAAARGSGRWLTGVLSASSSSAAPSDSLPPLKAAVIIPGFLNDQSDFEPLARSLSARGLPTAVVPLPLWHWIPQVGGRSVRPILERIDHAVRHVAAMGNVETTSPLVVPPVGYNALDCWQDFKTNPGGVASVGGSDKPDDYPSDISPCGTFAPAGLPKGRIALIGHSASGWMARIYLSHRSYGGKAYSGASLVHSLLTLGSPHLVGAGVPFFSVEWANREPIPSSVRCLAVGARGTPGNSSGSLTLGAYSFCTASGKGGEALDGDGITTLESATTLAGAEQLVLDGVTHYPWTSAPLADLVAPDLTKAYREEGVPWYGSESVIDSWLPWLLEGMQKS